MSKLNVVWRPTSYDQYNALTCPTRTALFHGPRGSGKTDVLLIDYLKDVGKGHDKDYKGILFRQTFPQLTEIVNKSHKLIKPVFPAAKWNGSKYCWHFPKGETLYLRYLRHEKDYWNYHGQEFAWMAFDELTNWATRLLIEKSESLLRSTNPNITKRIRYSTNPSGVGHGWVKGDHIDRGNPQQVYTGYDGLPACHFFLDIADNHHLLQSSPEYLTKLDSISDPNLKKAWRYGNWDIVGGGMFSDVFDRSYHVIQPFKIPRDWEVFRSFDWGSSKPFSVGWWAVSNGKVVDVGDGLLMQYPKGTMFRIAEWYGWNGQPNQGCRMISTEIARGIKHRQDAMGLYVKPGPADTSIFDVTEGESIADKMSILGIDWERASKGPGSRKSGWDSIRALLFNATKKPMEEPGLFIFSNCHNWIRTVPILPRDPNDLDDVDTDAEDHIGDETRYAVAREHKGVTQIDLNW